jgi:transcription elongation GreA/GreB family factor
MNGPINNSVRDFSKLVASKIEDIRPRLLDLTPKNPLVNMSFDGRSASQVRVIDELPDRIFYSLNNDVTLKFKPLPAFEEESKDELTTEFVEAVSIALRTDEYYLAETQKLDTEAPDYPDRLRMAERALRDRVRLARGMPKRITRKDESLAQHARNNGIDPSFDLPLPDRVADDGRFEDDHIQTLLLGPDLERKLNGLVTKARTAQQETGLNLLRGAFGFLEWKDPARADGRVYLSPLVLAPVLVERNRSAGGPIFSVEGTGEEAETNLVLREKFKREFAIDLPLFEGGSLEDYFDEIAKIEHAKLPWQVRRRITFSVFPAARMAMYEDLDTKASNFARNAIIETILVGAEGSEAGAVAEEYEVDAADVESEVPHLVKKADASQFSVVVDVARGRNLAVEGPPGTGKSDTIVNAIATALSKGKKVLFVAEKSAALEVVRSRLEAVGLGDFVLPLLAGKSSKDEFMRSIRDRIGLTESMPRGLQDSRERFVQVREKLSRYVSILAGEWEGTGETVHRVLGRAISTQHLLDGMSAVDLSEHSLPAREFRGHEIDELISNLAFLADMAPLPASKRTHWQGTTCLDTSQFKRSLILASAQKASDAFRKLAATTKGLREFGFADPLSLVDISAIEGLAEYVRDIVTGELSDDEARVALTEDPSALRAFVAKCESTGDHAKSLAQILIDPTEPNTAGRLGRINEICRSSGVRSLDASERGRQIASMAAAIEDFDKSVTSTRDFIAQYPPSSNWSVSAVGKLSAFIQVLPKSVLAMRTPALIDPSAVEALKEFINTGRILADKRRGLDASLDLRQGLRGSDIDQHLSVIRSAGALSFLSSNFKEAKRFYSSISKSGKFNKAEAVEALDRARSQLEEEARFEERSVRSGVFGARFDGIHTSFDSFEQLVDFYERVEIEFAGFANRDLREFLLSAQFPVLQAIPDLSHLLPDTKLSNVEATRDKLKADVSTMRSIDSELTQLCRVFHRPANVSPASLGKLLEELGHLQKAVSELQTSPVSEVLGDFFAGWKSDPSDFEYLIEVSELYQGYQFGDVFAAVTEQGRLQELLALANTCYEDAERAKVLLGKASDESLTDLSAKVDGFSFEQASQFLAEAGSDADALEHWIGVAKARSEIDRLGMIETVDLLWSQLDRADVAGHAEALLRRASAGRVYKKYGSELVNYSGRNLEALRLQLKKLDDEITSMSRKELRCQLLRGQRPPAGISRGRVGELTEMGLLELLAGQKRVRVPVRDITRRASRALLALKPCWMMSPLAVAQYIQKNTLEFDVCIIDEASQMPPEDAIGALFRSRQAMIVGDTQQLPPSNFFHKSISDTADDEETDAVTEESVLEMANAAFRPRRMLTWHYRSKHSGLINFSNNIIYDDRLTVFPSANEDNPKMGVSLVQTGGIYKAGVNTTEAHAVVEAALDFMRRDAGRSLGVVAVNKAQAEYINERIQYEITRDRSATDYVDRWLTERDGLEEFFVKNLENVQGDERDVIFVSTVYGPPSEGGKVAQHFGPIAGPSGRRRLNVLFTRAKEQIRTFTSMSASDITAEKDSNAGAWMLKRWLEYSAGGPLEACIGTDGAFDSPLEEFVAAQIKAMGCVAVPQVGAGGYSIDLGVRHPHWPHGFLMGVECDGATYHSSRSARDRDRHRQEVLENLGWHIQRVWSTDWFDNPRREADRLRGLIAARLEELKEKLVVLPQAPVEMVELAQKSVPAHSTGRSAVLAEQLALPIEPAERSIKTETVLPQARKSIRLGSKVRLRYLDRGEEIFQFTIIKEPSAPERGLVNQNAPLAKAVMDAEAGDEIEILLGSLIRKAVVETVG